MFNLFESKFKKCKRLEKKVMQKRARLQAIADLTHRVESFPRHLGDQMIDLAEEIATLEYEINKLKS